MKNLFKSGIILMLFFISLEISAQTKQEQLVGTWFFNYDLSLAHLEAEAKTNLDSMSELDRKKIEKFYKGRKIIFRSDGSFTQELSDRSVISGLWTFDNNGGNIIMSIGQNQSQTLIIKSLSSTSLIVLLDSKNKMKPMISEWYFTKN